MIYVLTKPFLQIKQGYISYNSEFWVKCSIMSSFWRKYILYYTIQGCSQITYHESISKCSCLFTNDCTVYILIILNQNIFAMRPFTYFLFFIKSMKTLNCFNLKVTQINYISRNQLHDTANDCQILNFGFSWPDKGKSVKAKHC